MPTFSVLQTYTVTRAQLKAPQSSPRDLANAAILAAALPSDAPVVGRILADVAQWLDLVAPLTQSRQFVLRPASANTRQAINNDITANIQNDGHSPIEAAGYLARIGEQLDLLIPMVGRYEIANGVLT